MNPQRLPSPPATPNMLFNFWPAATPEGWNEDDLFDEEWIPVPRSILPQLLALAQEERLRNGN